jgi:hypothetical protein
MWNLYLDESGDLGFDFVTRKPTKFFTVCILAVQGHESNRALTVAVRRTIRNKLHPSRKSPSGVMELKANSSDLSMKTYFYRHLSRVHFEIYALTLDKMRSWERLSRERVRIYDYMTGLLLEKIPLEKAKERVEFVIDRSMTKFEIKGFNDSVIRQLQSRINPKVPLNIRHRASHEVEGLQAADLFAWGVHRKHEQKDTEWFDFFSSKLCCDQIYAEYKNNEP